VRVLRLTGLADAFEGVVSCDYGAGEFTCKPEPGQSVLCSCMVSRQTRKGWVEVRVLTVVWAWRVDGTVEYFRDALLACGSPHPSDILFVDDSALNIKGPFRVSPVGAEAGHRAMHTLTNQRLPGSPFSRDHSPLLLVL